MPEETNAGKPGQRRSVVPRGHVGGEQREAGHAEAARSPPWRKRPSPSDDADDNLQALICGRPQPAEKPVKVRLAAIDTLATAAFSVIAFEPCRNDYIATLREVAEDPNPEIRESALGMLAGEKDGIRAEEAARRAEGSRQGAGGAREGAAAAQLRRARRGVCGRARDRRQAAEPRGQARGAAAAGGRRHVGAAVREGAARQGRAARESGRSRPSALHALNPKKLQTHARAMLVDKSEYDDIQATSLTALQQFGDQEAVAQDKALLKSVGRMSNKASSAKYKKSAKAFLAQYDR